MQEPRYIDEKVLSQMSGLAVQTLRNDRSMRKGIPFIKLGRSVKYDLVDVMAYMQRHRVETEG